MKHNLETALRHRFEYSLAVLFLFGLTLVALPKPVWAQDAKAPSAAAKAALDVLTQNNAQTDPKQAPTGSASPTSPAVPAQVSAMQAGAASPITPGSQNLSFVVQPGETLDRIIRARLPQAPFKNELIRRAFMDLNPSAFPLGTPHMIPAGAVLSVPTPEQIRQSALSKNPHLGAYLGSQDADEPTPRKGKEDRRKWVRFP